MVVPFCFQTRPFQKSCAKFSMLDTRISKLLFMLINLSSHDGPSNGPGLNLRSAQGSNLKLVSSGLTTDRSLCWQMVTIMTPILSSLFFTSMWYSSTRARGTASAAAPSLSVVNLFFISLPLQTGSG